ncbi:hypothetical protein LSCM4_00072 [Leishmania orientalis]|uniref:Protein kinase domain-containing protein n=1 Tax=Leishmania orientalis TaxID=2249476 RepID=A0A836KA61_9TRYP|nr:hypothetical protein LSCM4_00072 [Leishmania orientalis]
MWSVGCILGELMLGKPIFPGRSTTNQLELICSVTGMPSAADVSATNSQFAHAMLRDIHFTHRRTFAELLPSASPDALDLIQRLMCFNPNRRITAAEALEHPYVAAFHRPDEEPVAADPITISLPDNERLPLDKYRDAIYEQIAALRRGCASGEQRQRTERQTTGSTVPRRASSGAAASGSRVGTGTSSITRTTASSSAATRSAPQRSSAKSTSTSAANDSVASRSYARPAFRPATTTSSGLEGRPVVREAAVRK